MDDPEDQQETPEPVQPVDSADPADKMILAGLVWGGVAAFLASLALIILAIVVEQIQYGHQDWDHAIGLGFLPVIAVPIGVMLGGLVGVITAALRRK